jgi:hypothetical protein
VLLRSAGAALLMLGLAPAAPAAQRPDPGATAQASTQAQDVSEGRRCGSVVIRHCRLRRETSDAVIDPALSGRNGAPLQWEIVQFGGPDNDEIVVNGERIRDPGLRAVFDRAFGSPLGSRAMITRPAAAGARCTVIAVSGATLCSNGGNSLPALDNPLADWVF